MADKLIIFDTTLRDGEQSPGASMTRDEKLRIARQLERLRVDVIEAGFAASSNGDFEAVKAIADAIKVFSFAFRFEFFECSNGHKYFTAHFDNFWCGCNVLWQR